MTDVRPEKKRLVLPIAGLLAVLGAASIITGVYLIFWPAALIVGGLLLLVAGIDLRS